MKRNPINDTEKYIEGIKETIKRFCNALFFMSYILFHTIVFKKLSVNSANTNTIHFH